MVISDVVRQKASALSAGISIVRRILKEHQFPDGFTTKRLFELAQTYPPPPNFQPMKTSTYCQTAAPRPDHPIRSVTFLKTMILPALEGQQEIETVAQPPTGAHPPPDLSNLRPIRRQQRTALQMEFVWKIIPPEERSKFGRVPAEPKTVVGVEVGVGADTSHLNKRRQRARVKKVTEAVRKLRGELPFSKELKEVASVPV